MITKQQKENVRIALNNLKEIINPAYDNTMYQLWLKQDIKVPFRAWVIDKTKELILMELEH